MAKVDQEKLARENEILRAKIDLLEKSKSEAPVDVLSNEMKKIRQKGKSSANRIDVKEQNDHKNISLWTKAGKRIGPMHPENAIQTLNRFADIGIYLSADMPTPEQVVAYQQTAEYKKLIAQEAKRRATKEKSRRSGQMEKMCSEIAKMSGLTVEAINNVLKPEQVKKNG